MKPAGPGSSPSGAPERRQLTVMFCDLVGSTALSARLDPEHMGDVIRAFQGAVSAAAARFEGYVAKFMGDGALLYFGYPKAHEDDAERAVRAGLALIPTVRELIQNVGALRHDTGVALEVRSGIATGLVVVGELMGEGEARERGVFGETPHLASRLQALAEPGSVAIAETTRRLLGGTFEVEELGPQFLKGFVAPVPVWKVLREAANVDRFDALRSQTMTPFFGREIEIAELLDLWRRAGSGEGRVALLSGEAGIGKSRILAELRETIGATPAQTVRFQCSPHHVNDAFYPISHQIWQRAGLVSGEPASAALDKLETLVSDTGLEPREIAPWLASLLSVSWEGRYPVAEMTPAEQKERTITALIAMFSELSRSRPALALMEDVHWIDPSSLDVLGRLIDRLPSLRALAVITFRPEFIPPWASRSHVVSIPIAHFSQRQSAEMIDRVTGHKPLPQEVLQQIVETTDGLPLFVEELTKTVLESGQLREENGAWVLASALTTLAIPSTLQDSLTARLDRLAPFKEIAQIGAAIGREFSHRLLEAVSPIKGLALQDALGRLMAAELIHRRDAPPEPSYVFNHMLVRDTAYYSLLLSRRPRIHADIARALEERFADQIEAAPAVVAHHFTEGRLAEPAVRYWLKAAELALARSALTEAVRHADAGLALVGDLNEGTKRQSFELALNLARANALSSLKGYTVPETVAALQAANGCSTTASDPSRSAFRRCTASGSRTMRPESWRPRSRWRARWPTSRSGRKKTIYKLMGHSLIGWTRSSMGEFRAALLCIDEAERYRDPLHEKGVSHRFGADPDLSILAQKAFTLNFLGLYEQAERAGQEVQLAIRGHPHPPTVATWRIFVLINSDFSFGDFEAAERHSAEHVAHCLENDLGPMRLFGETLLAAARMSRAPTRENIEAYRAAIAANRSTGHQLNFPPENCRLAQGVLALGQASEAQALLDEAFAFVERTGVRYALADLLRIEGLTAIKRPNPDPARAEACFQEAIAVARAQEARPAELRAATYLARLWRSAGSSHDPRALLEPILAAIEGGERTRDVRRARALLAEVG